MTQAQSSANQHNALHSTGPRSVEGKAVSRFNALKHGIDARSLVIPGEEPEELAALADSYHQHFRPAGPVEDMLVRIVVQSEWLVRRYDRIEAALVTQAVGDRDPDAAVTGLFAQAASRLNPLPHLFRRRSAAQRDWFRALKELERLQKERQQASEAEEAKAEVPAVGFDLSEHPMTVAESSGAPAPVPEIAS